MKEGKSTKLNHNHHQSQQQQQQQSNGHISPFNFGKLLDPEASWDKDQLGDVLHWIRQVVGLICGLLWGAVPFVGAIWIVLFLVLSSGIVYGYYALILKVDEEDFGGHGTLLQEGLFASLTLFLVGKPLSFIVLTAQLRRHRDSSGLIFMAPLAFNTFIASKSGLIGLASFYPCIDNITASKKPLIT